jgi:hypothetical protein
MVSDLVLLRCLLRLLCELFQGISCLFNDAAEELMWGLMIQLGNFVPAKDSGLTNEDRFPMSSGVEFFMKSLNFEVEPDMLW